MASLSARALTGLPELRAGDDLAALIAASAEREQPLSDGAVLVIAHKAVSKAEGAVVRLGDVEAQERARELAVRFSAETGQPRDARAIQVVLDQSSEILRAERGVLICRTHHGFVCANAGVDASNAAEPDTLITLPRDPDKWTTRPRAPHPPPRRIRANVRELTGALVGVIVTDSFGRAWRNGQVD